jgi:hypothetical protein
MGDNYCLKDGWENDLLFRVSRLVIGWVVRLHKIICVLSRLVFSLIVIVLLVILLRVRIRLLFFLCFSLSLSGLTLIHIAQPMRIVIVSFAIIVEKSLFSGLVHIRILQ